MKILSKLYGNLSLIGLFLLYGCSTMDPEVPNVNSYEKAGVPLVSITDLSDITARRATIRFRVEDTGGKPLKKLLLCHSLQEGKPDTTNACIIPLQQDTFRISGLAPDNKYTFSIYAANQDTGSLSAIQSLQTKEVPPLKAWKNMLPYPGKARDGGTIAFSIAGKGYIGLGCTFSEDQFFKDLWAYDPVTGNWKRKNDFPGVARQEAMTMVIGSHVYLIGGHYFDSSNGDPVFLDDIWMYDPVVDSWERKKDFPFEGICDASTFVIDGKGYMQGGTSWRDENPEMWEYDPQLDTWCRKADYPGINNYDVAYCTYKSKAYLLCGGADWIGPVSDCWSYDPHSDQWKRLSDLSAEGREGASAFAVNDKIYLIGGYCTEGEFVKRITENFYIYQPDENSWYSTEQEIEMGMYSPSVFTLDGKAYIRSATNDMLRYDPALEEYKK